MRFYKKKTDRGSWGRPNVFSHPSSQWRDCCPHSSCATNYAAVACKRKTKEGIGTTALNFGPVFQKETERELVRMILEFERRGFSITVTDIRTLAFEFADANDIKTPFLYTNQIGWFGLVAMLS